MSRARPLPPTAAALRSSADLLAYGMVTKGAVVTLTRGLSDEVAAEGIRTDSVSPGVIATDMTSGAGEEGEEAAARSPLSRIGRPDEIAVTVSWLITMQSACPPKDVGNRRAPSQHTAHASWAARQRGRAQDGQAMSRRAANDQSSPHRQRADQDSWRP
jgi:NAD(P)-dependent dehydrogenase (short-subunit alcohol dehydrogenase family)